MTFIQLALILLFPFTVFANETIKVTYLCKGSAPLYIDALNSKDEKDPSKIKLVVLNDFLEDATKKIETDSVRIVADSKDWVRLELTADSKTNDLSVWEVQIPAGKSFVEKGGKLSDSKRLTHRATISPYPFGNDPGISLAISPGRYATTDHAAQLGFLKKRDIHYSTKDFRESFSTSTDFGEKGGFFFNIPVIETNKTDDIELEGSSAVTSVGINCSQVDFTKN